MNQTPDIRRGDFVEVLTGMEQGRRGKVLTEVIRHSGNTYGVQLPDGATLTRPASGLRRITLSEVIEYTTVFVGE
jgi:hypothetical protein